MLFRSRNRLRFSGEPHARTGPASNVLIALAPHPHRDRATALVKSGFQLPDPNAYFSQIEVILRRSLGVSQSAQAEIDVRPAPPVETGPVRPAQPEQPAAPEMADFAEWAGERLARNS